MKGELIQTAREVSKCTQSNSTDITLEGWLSSAWLKSECDINGTSKDRVDHGFSVAYCQTWNTTACHFCKQALQNDQRNQKMIQPVSHWTITQKIELIFSLIKTVKYHISCPLLYLHDIFIGMNGLNFRFVIIIILHSFIQSIISFISTPICFCGISHIVNKLLQWRT